jgi:hypothetical protein
MIRPIKDGRALLFALSALLVPSPAFSQAAPASPAAHDKAPSQAKKPDDPGAQAKKPDDPGAQAKKPDDPGAQAKKPDDPGAKPDPKAEKPTEKGEAKAEGKAGRPEGKPADQTVSAAQKTESDEIKLKERIQRRKSQQEAEQSKLTSALKGQPMTEAMQQELTRHGRRLARMERIRAVAREAKDAAAEQRVTKLIDLENARHDKFTANVEAKDEKAGAK